MRNNFHFFEKQQTMMSQTTIYFSFSEMKSVQPLGVTRFSAYRAYHINVGRGTMTQEYEERF